MTWKKITAKQFVGAKIVAKLLFPNNIIIILSHSTHHQQWTQNVCQCSNKTELSFCESQCLAYKFKYR